MNIDLTEGEIQALIDWHELTLQILQKHQLQDRMQADMAYHRERSEALQRVLDTIRRVQWAN